MLWLFDNALILSLLLVYTGLMIYHAWLGKRNTKSMADYYVGGRSMSGIALGISFFATYASTNTYLGFSTKAYELGIAWLLVAPFAVVFSFLSWLFIAAKLRERSESLDSITIPDFIGVRFGSTPARIIASLIVLCSSFLYMTAVFKGIGNLLETILEIPYFVAIALVLIIVMVYTAVGGFHSVVRTDVVQGAVMIVAAFLIFRGVTQASGGVASILDLRERTTGPDLFSWNTVKPLPVVIGTIFATTIKFLVDPRQLSRFFALKDRKERTKGIWVSTAIFAVVFSLLIPIGLYAHIIMGDGVEDTDQILPLMLNSGEVFASGVTAFLFLAIISAAMSSLDSVLLVMASTCRRDLTGLLARTQSEKGEVKMTRHLILVFATATALMALNPPGGIVAMTSFSGSLYAACFLPAILFGLYWHRGNGKAVISSYVAGLLVLISWQISSPFLPILSAVHPVFPAVLSSALAFVVVSMRIRGEKDQGTAQAEAISRS